jgi:hypothetical protein
VVVRAVAASWAAATGSAATSAARTVRLGRPANVLSSPVAAGSPGGSEVTPKKPIRPGVSSGLRGPIPANSAAAPPSSRCV